MTQTSLTKFSGEIAETFTECPIQCGYSGRFLFSLMKPALSFSAASAVFTLILAFPVMAQGKTSPVLTVRAQRIASNPVACLAKAAQTRDATISKALATAVTAIQTRSKAVVAANKLTDAKKKKAAITAADAAFKGTWEKLSAARKNAAVAYTAAAAACQPA